ncbi:MAG: TetR/AcrR family transcriptional regulator [Xenococcaceae cyanobacterium MO_188.B29]|nr:TetR/AcrR family transcriptional regulator [Xenococcaceae cyanobacterium MO_188.B29]
MSECQSMEEQQLKKRERILEAAQSCFFNYGFKRTSMEDIAKKVGISRPALYLHFQNKKAIFRALAAHLHQETLRQAEIALKGEGNVFDRILQAFERRSVELFALVCDSTHGEELIDINGQVATDIFLAAEQKFGMMLTQALRQAENNGEIQLQNLELNAERATELLINSAYGLKQASTNSEDYCSLLQQLIRVFEKALLV